MRYPTVSPRPPRGGTTWRRDSSDVGGTATSIVSGPVKPVEQHTHHCTRVLAHPTPKQLHAKKAN